MWLEGVGWFRIDARGNNPGVDARFEPPHERLAFVARGGEGADLPEIWADPLPVVAAALTRHATIEDVAANLTTLRGAPALPR